MSVTEARPWTEQEDNLLIQLKSKQATYTEIGEQINRSAQSVRSRWRKLERNHINTTSVTRTLITESPYPKYDSPLVMEGDALVLPDVEAPFHHADFLNRAIDLADDWGIRQCIVAGDLLHFDSISVWEANWMQEAKPNGLSDNDEKELLAFANDLPDDHRDRFIDLIINLGSKKEDGAPNVSQELSVARKVVKGLSEAFDNVDMCLGNHDSRFLKALASPMFPSEILRLVEAGDKWRIAPYYYSHLISNGEKYQIEHPKSYAKNSAYRLASKYQCHILHAHSHRWGIDIDISGKFYAISMGCVVDEDRLPYSAQRHHSGDGHKVGAVIVRDGYPTLLEPKSPWDRLKRM